MFGPVIVTATTHTGLVPHSAELVIHHVAGRSARFDAKASKWDFSVATEKIAT